MKKKSLLAFAALATLGGAAAAQSSVTVYGKVDLGMVYDAGAAAGKSVRLSNGVTGGSRLGFKGVEDLGGGTKFLFQLESGICIDSAAPVVSNGASVPNFCTGNNAFMGRQAHGDLSGSFGLLTAGRVYSFDFINQTTVDPFGTGLAGDSQNLFGDKSTSRLNNTVQYTTPAVGGLTVSGEVAFGETTGNWEAGRETGGAVTWTSGPAYVSLTILDQDNPNGNGSSRKNIELGATYDFALASHKAWLGSTVNFIGERQSDFSLHKTVTLPSYTTLVQEYDVARGTAAKAVQVLVGEGLVKIVPGRGAYVTRLDERA